LGDRGHKWWGGGGKKEGERFQLVSNHYPYEKKVTGQEGEKREGPEGARTGGAKHRNSVALPKNFVGGKGEKGF